MLLLKSSCGLHEKIEGVKKLENNFFTPFAAY